MHASNLAIAQRLSVWRFDLFDLNIESRAFWQGRERHPAILQQPGNSLGRVRKVLALKNLKDMAA